MSKVDARTSSKLGVSEAREETLAPAQSGSDGKRLLLHSGKSESPRSTRYPLRGGRSAWEILSAACRRRPRGWPMKPYALGREEGEAIWMFDSLDTIKADAEQTGGGFTVVEFLDFEGSSVPLHVNGRWDTGFYILDGEYTFVIADDTVAVSPGAWVYVPRRTPHAWRCDSAGGRLLNVTVPGGFEGFYRQAGESVPDRSQLPARREPDVQALSSTAAQYGIEIVGPPPGA
jgi:mannose-6-phosphate isomerase-like protein (cupin superfamily)